MKIAVTGSSGKLGAVVVRDLLDHGHAVTPIDMHPAADPSLPATRVLDLCRERGLTGFFSGCDAVCHLGNFPSFRWVGSPSDGYTNNVGSTYNVFDAAERAGVPKVVYASSVQVYGAFGNALDPRPQVSPPVYLPIDEDHPLLPRDGYPLSKATGERIADAFCRRRPRMQVFSLRFTGIRLPNGAALKPTQPVPFPLVGSLYTFVHVRDAARAVRLCCEIERSGNTPLNIVSPRATAPWSRESIEQTYGRLPEFRRTLNATDALIAGDRAAEILRFRADLPVPEWS